MPHHYHVVSRTNLRQIRHRRLLFRCWHRATQEIDLILGTFAENSLADLNDAPLEQFKGLLDCFDPDLFDWITARSAPPRAYDHDLMCLLRSSQCQRKG